MKLLIPLAVLVCMPFLMANSSKIPETVSHLSATMQTSSDQIIQALQQNQENAFPNNDS
ncbi:MAG TPA: hypothetical protein VGV92_03750 [Gammaproteobacteria bacterium]|nr:hypothetical protein [Gammaproteobacteria bacterium]